ncbi:calcium-binding protein [Candidatus Methylomirabilis sp.]|uniref:calcium-binding protein n=1 Tax=Candidatus Methylomirabilis sp. TaxID=2032687 RepID=UPI0030768274
MKKVLLTLCGAVLLTGLLTAQAIAVVCIKLFDATPTFDTGLNRPVAQARHFASTPAMLNFSSSDSAVISSTCNGTDPIVIDNFLTINGANACLGAPGQLFPESCFGPFLDPALPIGVPIQTVLTPIPPIDVSSFIPVGKTPVLFELRDFGTIAGNTDLFLVTTATAVTCSSATPTSGCRVNDQLNVLCQGTPGPDTIVGTPGDDVIIGLGGDDKIFGEDGDDVICGRDDKDTLVGGSGNDLIDGGDGNDKLFGKNGADLLDGGRGGNTLNGGPGADTCINGPNFTNCEFISP